MKTALLIGLFTILPALAQANQISVTVNGMVCGFCAQGIAKKFNAEPAVKKVDVSLEKKLVVVDLKEGKNLDDQSIERIFKESGYNVEKIARN